LGHEGVETSSRLGGMDRHGVKDLFHRWMQDFGVEYKNAMELARRMEIWTENHCTCDVLCV
jgi:hypothetical protein